MLDTDPHFQIAAIALKAIKRTHGLDTQAILAQVKQVLDAEPESYTIPVTIFQPGLSVLEAVCKYLSDAYNLQSRKIGQLIDRDTAVVSASIGKANRKLQQPFKKQDHAIAIPTSAFSASMGPLESLTLYLKTHYHISLSEIGRLLHRDPRNIWQSVNNAKKKSGGMQ